jgi:flagellar hook-associated protein 1 FlgK
MQSTFTGIEMGKRSVVTHAKGLSTVGHNIMNAATEGYSRQRVEMSPFEPIFVPGLNREESAGQMGQGVVATQINRIHDSILEGRIVKQSSGKGYWDVRDSYILMAEQVYNEPSEISVRSLMDKFWESWQEMAMRPEDRASRLAVLERGESLMSGIHRRYEGLKEIREMLEQDIQVTVDRVNALSTDIAGLNREILKVEAMGDNPNDLLDRRDLLVRKLADIVDITVDGRDADEFTVHTGGMHLVQGGVVTRIAAEPDPRNEGYSRVVWDSSGEDFIPRNGRLAALVELRDGDIRGEVQDLDTMTVNFVDMVNEVHRAAYGLNGKTGIDFFTEYPFVANANGNYDRNGDGEFDATYLFRINGSNRLDPQQQVGIAGTMTLSGRGEPVEIDYAPTDTVEDIVKRINASGSEVVARFDRLSRLTLKGTAAEGIENPDFVIRGVEDSGQFLTGYAGILEASGAEGAYSWEQADAVLALRGGEDGAAYAVAPLSHPSGWIEINREVKAEPNSIATGFGENGRPANPGDGSAALAVAALRDRDVMVGKLKSFDEYFASAVARIGLKGESAQRALQTEEAIMKDLSDMRESISGVNIDEELANMIKFQHGYAAASRFITTVDEMLDTIINRMGV